MQNPIARVLEQGVIVGLANHTILVRPDGSEVPIDDSAAPIRDRDGKPTGVVLVFRDISERKKTERELARLASFPARSPNPIVEVDLSGRVQYLNAAAQQLFPQLEEQGLAHPWLADWDKLIQACRKGNLDLITREVILAESYYQQFIYYVPEIERVRIYGYDINERKRAEETLRQSELRYRSLFENMLNGFAYCRMFFENNVPQDFTYLAVNHNFETLTGLKDVVGKQITQVIPGIKESNPEVLEIYGRVALTGKPESFETYIAPLGIWLSISVYRSEPEYFVAIFDNITERKRAEAEIKRQVEELNLANDELLRFNRAMERRELRMIELKTEVNQLLIQAGMPARYPLDFEIESN